MKFICTKENLLQGIQAVSPVTGKQVHLPILNNILLQAEMQGVKAIGTNLEMAITALIRGKVEIEGSFTIPAKTLVEYVSLLPNEARVDCELENNEFVLRSGKQKTKIKGMLASEFPAVPDTEKVSELVFSSDNLKQALQRVLVSVSHSEVRPELQGVLMQTNTEEQLRVFLASTDSYRLTEVRADLLQQASTAVRVIIPQRAAQEIARLLPNTHESVTLSLGDGQCSCVIGDVQIVSRLLDGNYPDYRQIIPKNWITQVLVNVAELQKGVRAASLFTTQGVNAVSVEIRPSEEIMHISSTSSQLGEHAADIAVEGAGEDVRIILNHRYLLDGLNTTNGEKVSLKIVSGESPCILVPEKSDDYLYIIMPIRQ